jgi:phosphoesterase RecJ-like protein
MLARAGAESSETEGLVNFLAGVEGAFAATLVQESHDGWRVSLRSTTEAVDVASLAALFGGGGHPRAAGCRLEPGRESVERFLDTIAAQLDKLPADAGTRPADARLVG